MRFARQFRAVGQDDDDLRIEDLPNLGDCALQDIVHGDGGRGLVRQCVKCHRPLSRRARLPLLTTDTGGEIARKQRNRKVKHQDNRVLKARYFKGQAWINEQEVPRDRAGRRSQ